MARRAGAWRGAAGRGAAHSDIRPARRHGRAGHSAGGLCGGRAARWAQRDDWEAVAAAHGVGPTRSPRESAAPAVGGGRAFCRACRLVLRPAAGTVDPVAVGVAEDGGRNELGRGELVVLVRHDRLVVVRRPRLRVHAVGRAVRQLPNRACARGRRGVGVGARRGGAGQLGRHEGRRRSVRRRSEARDLGGLRRRPRASDSRPRACRRGRASSLEWVAAAASPCTRRRSTRLRSAGRTAES